MISIFPKQIIFEINDFYILHLHLNFEIKLN